MTLFGVETKDVKPDKLPTIAQFIKRNRKPKSNVKSTTQIVWIPGKFDNFTLQTQRFRVVITPKHPFYPALSEFFANSETFETPIGVEITDWDKQSYLLYEPNEKGMWQELGDSGYRWVKD
jgi:hypothetical protein